MPLLLLQRSLILILTILTCFTYLFTFGIRLGFLLYRYLYLHYTFPQYSGLPPLLVLRIFFSVFILRL